MKKLAVVALGGNALLRGDEKGTIEEQNKNSVDTLKNLVYLIKEGYNLVISHGNGPQVGNILMRNDAGQDAYDIPQMPLDICVADSQGGIAYMIERNLRNILKDEGINKNVVSIVTQVVVDKDDPAFQNPTKRVGKIYTSAQAEDLKAKKGWEFKKSPKGNDAWRRVVPSPKPIEIINESIIRDLVEAGNIVIASGGGGIPVFYDNEKNLQPLEAVIDKDSASSLLAQHIGASELYILTDVPFVYANYGTPEQEILEFLDAKDTRKHIENGTFGEGSMAPKIEAALSFVENGGLKSVITEAKQLEDRSVGTRITKEY
ncbi:MAG: carbamate kinase [Bacteroidales bacterium]|nr:carbamate kinase [Bacteroidales bacterium]